MLRNIVQELERVDRDNDYFLYSKLDFALPFENPRWHRRLHSRVLVRPSSFGFHTGARHMILEDRLDVFWGAAHILPLGLPSALRKVVAVHDLVWRLYPETLERKNYFMHRLFAERSIQQASRLICFSYNTARDVERYLSVSPSKIEVIYPGVLPDYWPRDRAAAARHIAAKFQTSENYICAVGTVEPRKNLSTLIQAVKILHGRGSFPYQLLIAGGSGWKNSEIYRSVQQAGLTEREVKFLGYVPEEDLPMLYSGARVFAFPSLYEGFGIPLIEAMACGAPVVASNVSSIPEVVRDAAVLVSPQRTEDFADAMMRVTTQAELRRTLVEKGIQRAREFRCDAVGPKVLRLFGEVVAEAAEMKGRSSGH